MPIQADMPGKKKDIKISITWRDFSFYFIGFRQDEDFIRKYTKEEINLQVYGTGKEKLQQETGKNHLVRASGAR